jgi:hypothetical protein
MREVRLTEGLDLGGEVNGKYMLFAIELRQDLTIAKWPTDPHYKLLRHQHRVQAHEIAVLQSG